VLEKGIIHNNRSGYLFMRSFLLIRESNLVRIENWLGRDERNPGLGQFDVTMKIQPVFTILEFPAELGLFSE
jgi:hypothetical protein